MITNREELIKRHKELRLFLAQIRHAISEIVESGASSASISSGGGSKSYSHLSLSELKNLEDNTRKQLISLNRILTGKDPFSIRRKMIVRS